MAQEYELNARSIVKCIGCYCIDLIVKSVVILSSHKFTSSQVMLLKVQQVRNHVSTSQMGQLLKHLSAGLTAAPLI